MPIDKKAALADIYHVKGPYQRLLHEINTKGWGRTALEHFGEYRAKAASVVERLAPPESPYIQQLTTVLKEPTDSLEQITNVAAKIRGMLNALRVDYEEDRMQQAKQSDIPGFVQVEKLLTRFHAVAQQVKKRHDGRYTLWITDEYDVQDLLHALLRIEFDDIRPEEWTPSYAGKCSRMDFLLKRPKIVIEVKMTRDKLADKEIGEQLLVDITRYKIHPDCRTLICFVYDPDQRINNPAGLKHDLELLSSDELAVAVHICQH